MTRSEYLDRERDMLLKAYASASNEEKKAYYVKDHEHRCPAW